MTAEAIYVISTLSKSKKNKYKAGRHTGTPKKLLSRYQTSLINPILFYFKPVDDGTKIENILKAKLKNYRIKNNDGKYTEWILMELKNIITTIEDIVSEDADNSEENADNSEENADNSEEDVDNSEEDDDNIKENYDIANNDQNHIHNDPIGSFMSEYVETTGIYNNRIFGNELFIAFNYFNRKNSMKFQQKEFYQILQDKHFEVKIFRNRKIIRNVRLKKQLPNKILSELLENEFEVTYNVADFVTVPDMNKFRNKNKKEFFTISSKRFNDLVYETFKIRQTSKGKHCVRGWVGIKQKLVFEI